MEVHRAWASRLAAPVPAQPQGVLLKHREHLGGLVQGLAGRVAQEISGVQGRRLPIWARQALPLRDDVQLALQAVRALYPRRQGAQRERRA